MCWRPEYVCVCVCVDVDVDVGEEIGRVWVSEVRLEGKHRERGEGPRASICECDIARDAVLADTRSYLAGKQRGRGVRIESYCSRLTAQDVTLRGRKSKKCTVVVDRGWLEGGKR